jgi:uncharacterized membrane protein
MEERQRQIDEKVKKAIDSGKYSLVAHVCEKIEIDVSVPPPTPTSPPLFVISTKMKMIGSLSQRLSMYLNLHFIIIIIIIVYIRDNLFTKSFLLLFLLIGLSNHK